MGVTKPRKLKGNKNYMYTQENIEKDWSSNSLIDCRSRIKNLPAFCG
jgi:hypothetical protein